MTLIKSTTRATQTEFRRTNGVRVVGLYDRRRHKPQLWHRLWHQHMHLAIHTCNIGACLGPCCKCLLLRLPLPVTVNIIRSRPRQQKTTTASGRLMTLIILSPIIKKSLRTHKRNSMAASIKIKYALFLLPLAKKKTC